MSERKFIPNTPEAFLAHLKKRRMGLSWEEFAAKLGVSRSTVEHWKRGGIRPQVNVLESLGLRMAYEVVDETPILLTTAETADGADPRSIKVIMEENKMLRRRLTRLAAENGTKK